MNGNRKREKKQAAINNSSANVFQQEEIRKKISEIQTEMKAYTWRELETRGKFDKNAKISFISDDMLILGCDIGSDTHYARAIDSRGRELSKGAFAFHNSSEGFGNMKSWVKRSDHFRQYSCCCRSSGLHRHRIIFPQISYEGSGR